MCNNPNSRAYKYYGGKGIEFRFGSFKEFLDCLGARPEYLVLGRIDKNGHFEVGNVRWATYSYNNNRRSFCKRLVIGEEDKSAAEWAVTFGLKKGTVRDRLLRGWIVEEAVKVPAYKGVGVKRYNRSTDIIDAYGGPCTRLHYDIMDVYVEALVLRDKVLEHERTIARLKKILREQNLVTEYELL
jgi:hypothetical protein